MTRNPWTRRLTSRTATMLIITGLGTLRIRRITNPPPTPATTRPGARILRCISRLLPTGPRITPPPGIIRGRRRMCHRHPHSRADGSHPPSSSVRWTPWSPRTRPTRRTEAPGTKETYEDSLSLIWKVCHSLSSPIVVWLI